MIKPKKSESRVLIQVIFAKAVARVVDLISQNGENPQSSVVPNSSKGIYLAASGTLSRTSSGLST
jgi:hypothetical protein